MSTQCYIPKTFREDTYNMIAVMNGIIGEYMNQGYVLTVRQLYYQLVARDIIPNTLQEYKRAASIINDGKLAGLIDWDALEDRTRSFVDRTHWDSGAQIVRAAADGYHMDLWANQPCRQFVIVEKEALVGVLDRVCRKYDVPLLAARGYPSGSVLREFAEERLIPAADAGQGVRILHLGDHDPSGIDMTRDLEERLNLFAGFEVEIERLALNMDQIEELRPPENPAKSTDSRYTEYRRKFGSSSWELDALQPQYLNDLVENGLEPWIDPEAWEARSDEIEETRAKLTRVANQFETDEGE